MWSLRTWRWANARFAFGPKPNACCLCLKKELSCTWRPCTGRVGDWGCATTSHRILEPPGAGRDKERFLPRPHRGSMSPLTSWVWMSSLHREHISIVLSHQFYGVLLGKASLVHVLLNWAQIPQYSTIEKICLYFYILINWATRRGCQS